jgi:hypothetical protein
VMLTSRHAIAENRRAGGLVDLSIKRVHIGLF